MLSALLKRRPGRSGRSRSLPAVPYRVECACGKLLTGERAPTATTVRCKSCGQNTLIFPVSPLANLRETIREALRNPSPPPATANAPVRSQVWRTPLLAAGITLIFALAGLVVLLNSSLFRQNGGSNSPAPAGRSPDEDVQAGRRALADELFPQAAEYFRNARQALESRGDEASRAEARRLGQLEREAALMGDLLAEPLADILQRESGKSDAAWKEHFRKNYLDGSVIFDAPIHSTGAGVFRVDYPIVIAGRPARVELHDPPALRTLKVEWPARLLIGIRLAEPLKDARGDWLILARPDGVIMFTEPAMFRGSSVPADADLAEQLRRQSALLDMVLP